MDRSGDGSASASSDLVQIGSDRDGVVYRRRNAHGSLVTHDYHRPFILELELTWACNLNCVHCYVDASEEGGREEISFECIQRVIRDAAKRGIPELSLTGGEVLARPDFLQVLALGHDCGMGLRFVTNGTLVDDDFVRRLRPYPIKLVTVSLDAIDREIHDGIRGCACYDRTIAGIDRLINAGYRVSIITAFSQSNLSQFEQLLAWVVTRRLDWQVQMTSVKGRCPREDVLTPEQYYDLGLQVASARAADPPINIIPMDDLATFSRFSPLNSLARTWQGGCSGGRLNLFVRADGSVTPCSALATTPFVVGNVNTESLLTMLDEERCRTVLAPWLDADSLTGFCAACPHRRVCRGGCPDILSTMCDGRRDNRYCFWQIEEERIRSGLKGLW